MAILGATMDWDDAARRIEEFLATVLRESGMELTYAVRVGSSDERVRLSASFAGADARLLTARNAEVLLAMESLATAVLRLAPEEHDQVSFDAEGYKARRAEQIARAAAAGVDAVRQTGRSYAFPPMNSRERRMLHLELVGSGLRTASSGEAARRFVVLYPEGSGAAGSGEGSGGSPGGDRAKVIRNAFRPR